jgi:hypothetical protein
MALPPCGLYKTTIPIGPLEADRLVYFHNHGDPGPGLYPPESWAHNRASFAKRGVTLDDESLAGTLEPLPAEGLYRVTEEFTCCAKACRSFPVDLVVQLGYDAMATPILFVPRWTDDGLRIPDRGHKLDEGRLRMLAPLRVAAAAKADDLH